MRKTISRDIGANAHFVVGILPLAIIIKILWLTFPIRGKKDLVEQIRLLISSRGEPDDTKK